jgi:predicted RNA-binding protein
MCEPSVYLIKDGEEKMILESVEILEAKDGQVHMVSVFGEERHLDACVKTLSLVDHKIVLEPLG